MAIEAIDELGQIVTYVSGARYIQDTQADVIHIYNGAEEIAAVPGHWIVKVIPFSQVDPGVEARV